jgi:surface antigen
MKPLLTSALTVAILATPTTALAQPLSFNSDINSIFSFKYPTTSQPLVIQPDKKEEPKQKAVTPAEPVKPAPVVYTVVDGDNLSKIGTAYNVEWQRLWAKNTQLTNPDLIHVGDQITIPTPDEVLQRDLPAVVNLPANTPDVTPLQNYSASSGAGNTYDYGYCTWYVKNRRGASLPNGLGNANTWYARAQAMGMAVGSAPRPGAVGTTTRGSLGHVVYVESVNGDSITISEMNASAGWGAVNTRTASAGEFQYIY